MGFLIVFIGAGIGGMLRHGANLVAARVLGTGSFPYGTLAINVAGSFVMGVVVEYWALRAGLPQHVRLFLTTGVLGGFTTFSAFSMETVLMYERGQDLAAIAYAFTSVMLAVAAFMLGLALIRITLPGAFQ